MPVNTTAIRVTMDSGVVYDGPLREITDERVILSTCSDWSPITRNGRPHEFNTVSIPIPAIADYTDGDWS